MQLLSLVELPHNLCSRTTSRAAIEAVEAFDRDFVRVLWWRTLGRRLRGLVVAPVGLVLLLGSALAIGADFDEAIEEMVVGLGVGDWWIIPLLVVVLLVSLFITGWGANDLFSPTKLAETRAREQARLVVALVQSLRARLEGLDLDFEWQPSPNLAENAVEREADLDTARFPWLHLGWTTNEGHRVTVAASGIAWSEGVTTVPEARVTLTIDPEATWHDWPEGQAPPDIAPFELKRTHLAGRPSVMIEATNLSHREALAQVPKVLETMLGAIRRLPVAREA